MTDPVYEMFVQQIGEFKASLVILFKRKAKLIAERETLRFRYLAGVKSEIQNAIGRILVKESENPRLDDQMIRRFTANLTYNIPMVSMDGSTAQGWGAPPLNMGYTHLLAPMNKILSLPHNPPQDERPAYKVYPHAFLENPEIYLEQSWFSDRKAFTKNVAKEIFLDDSLVMTTNWFTHWLKWNGYPENLVSQLDTLNEIISSEFTDILRSARTMLLDLIKKTLDAVKVQMDIDNLQEDLSRFVNTYKDTYAQGMSVEQIMAEAEELTNRAEPETPAQVEISSEPEKKSKLPLIIAAAVGAFTLLRK
ncbi:MAG: hypothetical protein HC883_00230 [Bdellovibrionaceae bacterium]|nr:hypothetical protein [Pseudobdellovibrionaceae bacterium]